MPYAAGNVPTEGDGTPTGTKPVEVAAVKTVEDSAITLIDGLIARVVAAGTDQAALDQAVAELEAGKAALASAVAAAPPAA